MSKNKKQNSLYTIGFILVVIIVAGIYFSVYSKNSSNDTNPTTTNQTSSLPATNTSSDNTNNDQNPLTFNGTIYYINEIDSHNELLSTDNDSQEKVLYTDADENDKIKFAKSMTNSAKFLALIAPADQEFGGSLYLISSDGSGNKEKIIDEFASPQPPVISSDAAQIAYVLFSNAEMEYGFSLYSMNLNGENKTKIDTDTTMISNPAFDQNAKNIAYRKNNEIVVSDINGANKKTVYSLNNNDQLQSINWDTESTILIALTNNNETKIIGIDPTNKDNKVLYKSNNVLTDPVYVDSDQHTLAVLNTDTGKIEIIDLNNNQKELVNAKGIIKWLK